MLLIGGRSPNKILYSQASGQVWQTDLVPLYDNKGELERNEPVPFRLTRNMVAFLSMFGVDGLFVTAMVCIAQVRTLLLELSWVQGLVWLWAVSLVAEWRRSRSWG